MILAGEKYALPVRYRREEHGEVRSQRIGILIAEPYAVAKGLNTITTRRHKEQVAKRVYRIELVQQFSNASGIISLLTGIKRRAEVYKYAIFRNGRQYIGNLRIAICVIRSRRRSSATSTRWRIV